MSERFARVNLRRAIHRNSDWTEEERYNPDEAERKYQENLRFFDTESITFRSYSRKYKF